MLIALATKLVLVAVPTATLDNNVEWAGVSHVAWLDRRPLCPLDGETFDVLFQTFRFDIDSARVFVNDGSAVWVNAAFDHDRGPYAIWRASIPATAASSLSYYIELTDGTDTDFYSVNGMSETTPVDGGLVLDYVGLTHAPLGATLTTDGGAVFRVWAPGATSAALRGVMNAWGITAMTGGGGFWTLRFANILPGDMYKYFFSGIEWSPDARNRAWNSADNNNSFVIDPFAYTWGDQDFVPPQFEEMVVYELHVGTFSGRGDGLNRMGLYRDVVDQHLDHLLRLGVNVVELMPVAEFDGFNSWGYNPANQWGVEESYGSPDDLKYLIDTLHQNGIAVLNDVVYNHFTISGNEMWCYDGTQSYFDGNCVSGFVDTPWGAQADFDSAGVADYFADNALYWLDEYHMDGYRMDATRFMRDNFIFPAGQSSGWFLMREINDRIDNRAADKISIAEELPNDTAITRSTAAGGAGFDSQWHDQFVDNVRGAVVAAAFGNASMANIVTAINASAYPNKTHLVRYIDSHDEAGNQDRLPAVIDAGNPGSVFARGRTTFAEGLALTVPGIPMFFQGSEWLEDTHFDSQLTGRIDWALAAANSDIVQLFSDLISVRKSNCAMRSDGGHQIIQQDDANEVIAFQRFDQSGNILQVVASLNNNDLNSYRVGFPQAGTWYELVNSQAAVYGGNGAGNGGSIVTEPIAWAGATESALITVPKMSITVFRFEDPAGRSTDLNGDTRTDLGDYARMQVAFGSAGCGLAEDVVENGRVDLADVAEVVNNLTGP
ncbi:MAG: alpha-amylase family glycosyl hydrolase [Phycisphaerae bacterium]